MYTRQVADHIANPRNVGEIEEPSGVGDVTNEVCLDRIKLTIRVEGETLVEARVKARGCPPTIAAASALTELITGRTMSEISRLTREDIVRSLGRLPSAKKHCAVLAIDALRAAAEDHEKRRIAQSGRH
jgi:NifU-like protein involved in Fe-S cluster formation